MSARSPAPAAVYVKECMSMRTCWSVALLCSLAASGCALDEASDPPATDPSESTPAPEEAVALIPPPDFYSYSASNTNDAQQNTVNQTVVLNAGWEITLGTCGQGGSAFTGDTYLRLFGPSGTEVASNDNACGGLGSSIVFRVTTSGPYQIRGGCAAAGSCTGTVKWVIVTVAGSYSFSASNTNSAQQNTIDQYVWIQTGRKITVGTCGLAGSSASGDTYLRIHDSNGTQVAANDDACGSLASNLSYTSTAYVAYRLRAGCYSSSSCSGTVAWTIQ
jgi:lysyl endopeptidase